VTHHATPPAAATNAIAGQPSCGRHAPRSRRGSFISGPLQSQGVGATGLETDNAQPMRSCPHWFQIGLLPFVNDE
jgi:hypothetical protein